MSDNIISNKPRGLTPSSPPLRVTSGGIGLNIASASHLILYEPFWTPGLLNQVIRRLNQLGYRCLSSEVTAFTKLYKESPVAFVAVLRLNCRPPESEGICTGSRCHHCVFGKDSCEPESHNLRLGDGWRLRN